MKVQNMTSSRGNKVANQFILEGTFNGGQELGMLHHSEVFQSYNKIIVVKATGQTILDINAWDCSVTTSKYRNQFLGESKKETQAKIDSGEYLLADLN